MKRLLLAALLLAAVPALAQEEREVALVKAPGSDAVENNCAACHTLAYVEMNSPFLSEAGWTAEVTKMIKAFGAPIEDADAKTIIQYLAANYGAK